MYEGVNNIQNILKSKAINDGNRIKTDISLSLRLTSMHLGVNRKLKEI